MSERTITLNSHDIAHLRMGATVVADDSTDRPVDLTLHNRERHNNPLVRLTPADLDLIESDPEGLGVADTARTTGWTVRVAS